MGLEADNIARLAQERIAYQNSMGQNPSVLDSLSYVCRITLGREVMKKYTPGRGMTTPTFSELMASLSGRPAPQVEVLSAAASILGGSIGHYERVVAEEETGKEVNLLADLVNDSVTGTALPTVGVEYLAKAYTEGYTGLERSQKEATYLRNLRQRVGSLRSFYSNNLEFNRSSAGHFLGWYLGTLKRFPIQLRHDSLVVAEIFEDALKSLDPKRKVLTLEELREKWVKIPPLEH